MTLNIEKFQTPKFNDYPKIGVLIVYQEAKNVPLFAWDNDIVYLKENQRPYLVLR